MGGVDEARLGLEVGRQVAKWAYPSGPRPTASMGCRRWSPPMRQGGSQVPPRRVSALQTITSSSGSYTPSRPSRARMSQSPFTVLGRPAAAVAEGGTLALATLGRSYLRRAPSPLLPVPPVPAPVRPWAPWAPPASGRRGCRECRRVGAGRVVAGPAGGGGTLAGPACVAEGGVPGRGAGGDRAGGGGAAWGVESVPGVRVESAVGSGDDRMVELVAEAGERPVLVVRRGELGAGFGELGAEVAGPRTVRP